MMWPRSLNTILIMSGIVLVGADGPGKPNWVGAIGCQMIYFGLIWAWIIIDMAIAESGRRK